MTPKSLKLGLVSQIKFSNYLKPSQIFSILTAQPNPCMQSVDLIDVNQYSRRFFEGMRPIATKLPDVPDRNWNEKSAAQKEKLCVPVEIDVPKKTATESIKNNQYNKLIYYQVEQLELGVDKIK